MQPGFLVKPRKRLCMEHFAFKTWGPLHASLKNAAKCKGGHTYKHLRNNRELYCWDFVPHPADLHYHSVYTRNDSDIEHMPEWIRERMVTRKEAPEMHWCCKCVWKHNERARQPRTTAEYWAFWTLYNRYEEASPLSLLPREVAALIASHLLGPYVPKLRFEMCPSLQQQQLIRILNARMREYEESFSSDEEEEEDSLD